jgi:hypothetical protein
VVIAADVVEEIGEVTFVVIEEVVRVVVWEVEIVVLDEVMLEVVQDTKIIDNTMRQLSAIQNNPFFIWPPTLFNIYWRLIKFFL